MHVFHGCSIIIYNPVLGVLPFMNQKKETYYDHLWTKKNIKSHLWSLMNRKKKKKKNIVYPLFYLGATQIWSTTRTRRRWSEIPRTTCGCRFTFALKRGDFDGISWWFDGFEWDQMVIWWIWIAFSDVLMDCRGISTMVIESCTQTWLANPPYSYVTTTSQPRAFMDFPCFIALPRPVYPQGRMLRKMGCIKGYNRI